MISKDSWVALATCSAESPIASIFLAISRAFWFYIEVLDAERSLFATQQTILDLTYSRQVNEINLFTALGGGWVE